LNKPDQTSDKKAKILDAAAVLLSKKGVQSFSFENVAYEAGLSRQLVRYYYSDLDTLIADLCEHLGKAYQDILVAGIVDIQKVGRLKFFLDFFFDVAEGHPMPDTLSAYDAMVAYAVGSPELRDRMCDRYKTLGQVVMHELAIAYPELEGAACEELSFMFVSMMHAHWSFVASLGYSRQHSLLARKAFDRLIESYRNDPSQVPLMDRPWSREK
jgi:AcrR family transcriptional regulator